MEILIQDDRIVVCVKPAGILSTDEPGGLPGLVREALGLPKSGIRTVHRLDRVAAGLMVLARTRRAAADLSQQLRCGRFEKEYLAVVHGIPKTDRGTFSDLLFRDTAARRSFVVPESRAGAQAAVLSYVVLATVQNRSLVRISLDTGRTHQIRVQFSARGMSLVGDRKYGAGESCPLALWSCRLAFDHPRTGARVDCALPPPPVWPWTEF